MLVLSRKPQESIVLTLPSGETIRVTLVCIKEGKAEARIGIDAPASVNIVRSELLEKPNATQA